MAKPFHKALRAETTISTNSAQSQGSSLSVFCSIRKDVRFIFARDRDVAITMTPYYAIEIDGVETIIRGTPQTKTYNEANR